MKPDDLEERIKSQPWRAIPSAWRESVLAAARQETEPPHGTFGENHGPRGGTVLLSLRVRVAALLWPSPAAWAGLAAVWIVILGFQVTSRETGQAPQAQYAMPPSDQFMQAFLEQRRRLAEFDGRYEPPPFLRPKSKPNRPRSDRGNQNFATCLTEC